MSVNFQIESPPVEEWKMKLLGKAYVANGETALLSSAATFTDADLSGVESIRIIKPNTPVTHDYRTNRLNISLDANNVCYDVGFY